ncbi:MAG: hypothetical protein QXL51_01380 [Candidatus Aenigmatarchaeota archaeon]
MKKLIPLIFFLIFLPIVKAEWIVTFMNSTFPYAGKYSCSIASNGKFYCTGQTTLGYGAFYEYDPANDTLKNVYNYSGYPKANCIARPYDDEILCVEGKEGCTFAFFFNSRTAQEYCMPYYGWIVCNSSGYSYSSYYGGGCFLNQKIWYGSVFTETLCVGGKVWVGYPINKEMDVCDLLWIFWEPRDNVILQSIDVEPDFYKFGHSCASYEKGKSVCLGGNISHSDVLIVNFSIAERFRASPNIWHMSCVSPNLVSYYTTKNFSKDVYCIGGYLWDENKPSNKIYLFSPETKNFSEFMELPFTIYSTSCQPSFNGEIYCFGGILNGSYTNKIFKLSKPIIPKPPKPPCRICDYSHFNPRKLSEWLLIGLCLLLNLIFCNSIFLMLVIIFLIFIYVIKRRSK